MTSQGQRFRRKALRRGYKVDEVDAFLDRVEATLAGDPPGGVPVSAQEVHDVVFRVRFGGYDEWQVDLHLDRVERQLAELEERTAAYGREQRAPQPSERMAPPDRMAPAERMAPPMMRDDRMMPPPPMAPPMNPPMTPPPMAPRPVAPAPAGPPPGGFDPYDEPTRFSGGYDNPFEPGRHGKSEMTTEIRIPDSGFGRPYAPAGPPPTPAGPPTPVSTPNMSLPPEVAHIDQLRRTFQLRRFGSGYDRVQVDRLFENIVSAMASGRGPVALSEAELDPSQFSLVPGGYFEAEVDAALKEVRDILGRRR
ncbi:DivIVA domain-containing protein [Planosporangium thailandense]|uniref:Cell wall synthesis protein Wag31 n=1 Tax=Planosporangium thailandense TaxID=765197 RepID=A0ABX0XQG4_9ACTN|nr:DivIVA domain-containing protein [Planosporangium thailandense]